MTPALVVPPSIARWGRRQLTRNRRACIKTRSYPLPQTGELIPHEMMEVRIRSLLALVRPRTKVPEFMRCSAPSFTWPLLEPESYVGRMKRWAGVMHGSLSIGKMHV